MQSILSIRDLHFHFEKGLEGEKDLSPRNSAFKLTFSAYCKHICDWMLSVALAHPTSLLQVSSSDLDTAWKLIQCPMAFGDLCHIIRFGHFFFQQGPDRRFQNKQCSIEREIPLVSLLLPRVCPCHTLG